MYTHLHVHSEYSLLEATPSVDDLAARAAADGSSHLALTDTNALYGAVAFQNACRQHGITPITGMTIGLAPLPDARALPGTRNGIIVLLASGPDGYRSLCCLSTALQGTPNREAQLHRGLTWKLLKENTAGLICLSGGQSGWIERALASDDETTAALYAGRLAGLFGDNFYLGIDGDANALGSSAQSQRGAAASALAARFGLQLAAVRPIYCMEEDERNKLRLLAAIQQNCLLEEVDGTQLPDRGDGSVIVHWPTPEEMQMQFSAFPEALRATQEIADRCVPALPDGSPIWPIPKTKPDESPEQALRKLTREGLLEHYGASYPRAIEARLKRELAAIQTSGYTPLFLVVADIVKFAVNQGIPVSTRGSVADSLAAYCAGITTVDPVHHDLLFERFLNPARTSLPDIDLDFCSRRRDEVLEYVRSEYGETHVALVATVSTMRPKSAVRETAKAYGLDEPTIRKLINMLPSGWHPDPRRRDRRGVEEIVAQIDAPTLRSVMRTAYSIVGQPHHLSIHPGGVVITPESIARFVPLQWTAKGFLITQFDHADVEALGLPKIDLLGIRALTVLADVIDFVGQRHPDAELEQIPQKDAATADLLERGDTIGVFQCESTGAQRTLRQLKARNVQDLAVANAFFKPGPATGGMASAFIRRYRGEEEAAYLHPALKSILEPTKGVLLFQEQVLRIATEVAGLTWGEADHIRRGISKFEANEMAAMRDRFVTGCCVSAPNGPGFTATQAATLWQQVEAFAGYGFNQGHATAYADVSYRSAFFKTHWPAEFLCARLMDWGGFHHQAVYIAEAQRLGIPVMPPHINHSGRKFTLTDQDRDLKMDIGRNIGRNIGNDLGISSKESSLIPTLWMGLGQVRDLRRRSIRAMIAARHAAIFGSLGDLLRRVNLQTREVQHLIRCGALDGLGGNRATLLAEAADHMNSGSAAQMAFDFVAREVEAESTATRYQWERDLLGQPLSVHPLDLLPPNAEATPIGALKGGDDGAVLIVGARLPGWTGGKGYFLQDHSGFVVAIPPENSPKIAPWQTIMAQGRWRNDSWGSGWFQINQIVPLDQSSTRGAS